jgi:hypothetical protein
VLILLDSSQKLGIRGAPKNLFRDLLTAFGLPPGAPSIKWIKIRTKHGLVPHPFVLPHVFFQHMFDARKDGFNEFMLGGADDAFFSGPRPKGEISQPNTLSYVLEPVQSSKGQFH